MRGPRSVTWLLTLGLALAVVAATWQHLEEGGRECGGSVRLPAGMDEQPRETLGARIRASWLPGDRLRGGLLLAGLGLCLAGAWRAWRGGAPAAGTARRVGLTLAILGASCLLLGIARGRTRASELTCRPYVSTDLMSPEQPGRGRAIGMEMVLESDAPAGMAPLLYVGAALLGSGLLLGVLSLLTAPRVPRDPEASPARHRPRREGP